MMNSRELYELLCKSQQKLGYLFNIDEGHTMEILDGLLKNKERYGYMVCPCRLASGEYELDRDIICPCEYREADVKEYGSCYCTLYVSDDFNKGKVVKVVVPERRPPEKMVY